MHGYLLAHTEPLDEVQQWLISRTEELGGIAMMQVAPEQGALMTMLTQLVGATQALEVGTFTGYSALCIARGLAPGGQLLCCDVSDEWTSVGREAWARAGVDDRIELRIAPALETLESLPTEPYLDLAFIDADKTNYVAYFEAIVPRLRPNGLLLVDNTLWSGVVIDANVNDDQTEAIRAFNDHAAADARVDSVMLPVSDGLSLFRRRTG